MNISKELYDAVTDNSWVEYDFCMFKQEVYDRLFFLCKEWAYNKQNRQYYIESGYTKYDCYAKVWFDGGRNKEFISKTEQQSVFDACTWLLEKK